MYWIHDFSPWLMALVTVLIFLTVAIGGLLLCRRFISSHLVFSRDINDAVNYFAGAMATLYSVTLGLIAVASWQNYSSVESLVSKEASTIGVLYRDVGGYPEPLVTELRQQLRAYTVFVIEKTWPAQQHGVLLDDATYLLTEIHEKILAYEPPSLGRMVMHAEAMRKFNELVDLRRQRVDRVDDGLPLVLWAVLGIGGMLTLGVTFFFGIKDARFHALLLSTLTVFIALMVYLIAILDHPFRGVVSVTADSYKVIIQRVMDPLDAARARQK